MENLNDKQNVENNSKVKILDENLRKTTNKQLSEKAIQARKTRAEKLLADDGLFESLRKDRQPKISPAEQIITSMAAGIRQRIDEGHTIRELYNLLVLKHKVVEISRPTFGKLVRKALGKSMTTVPDENEKPAEKMAGKPLCEICDENEMQLIKDADNGDYWQPCESCFDSLASGDTTTIYPDANGVPDYSKREIATKA